MIVPHDEIRQRTLELYAAGGLKPGCSTGWPSLDKLYTVGLAQWTLVTGTPHSGKSEWLDALMVNLAKREPWRFFIYSPENWPLELHHSKIIEKYMGKPFNPGPTPRADLDDVEGAEAWMAGKFLFCIPERPDIVSILEEAMSVRSLGAGWKTGVVIDPWNQLEHYRPANLSETEYISQTLSHAINFVREYGIHLWIVAHPAKLQKDKNGKYQVPGPWDVSGSAHWWNKSDNCITIWRDQAADSPEVDVLVQKVRHKNIGHIGMTTLIHDRVTGQYRERPVSAVDYRAAAAGE
jgi:twinkle protein